jgi:hypothetical protein
MHERTRRAVARLLFVLVCALPTLAVCFFVFITFTPWFADYRRACLERELSLRIGLAVEIDAVEYPAPAAIRLTGVRLLEPETRVAIAKARMVTWVATDTKSAFRLSQPEIQSSMLPYVWRLVHERFLCQPELTNRPVRMAADDLTIHSRTGSMTLQDVDSFLRPVERGVEAVIECVPAGRTDRSPVHISVIRDRTGALPTTDWTMKTGDVPLMCSALADYFPAMKSLGPEATFRGTMRWRPSDKDWSLDLGGSYFDDIDMAEVMRGTPHRLSGRMGLRLERCLVEPGSTFDIAGTLVGESGFVSQSLLQELQSHVGFKVASMIEGDKRDWPYETMALRFDLFGPDMTLSGACHRQRGHEGLMPGTVFATGGRGFCESAPVRQSWVGLARALWPENTELLPVSTQTAWLFNFLPAPKPAIFAGGDGAIEPPRITDASDLHGVPTISQP